MTTCFIKALVVALVFGLGCTSCTTTSSVGRLRFVNRAPVWRVDDRKPVVQPTPKKYAKLLYFTDAYVTRRLPRALEFRGHRHARGTTSVDEVPDSSWFTNRIGRYPMTVAQVRRGPSQVDSSPERYRPWVIRSSKVGGASVGFIIEDQRGIKYLLKFDEKNLPEMETAAAVIVQRILYACGYNVPEHQIVYFRKGDLVLAHDAVVEDTFGDKRQMTAADMKSSLGRVHIGKDGQIRGMVSRFLSGVLLGGIPMEGVREDDPNDRVPHELRRDVRGLESIFAWLGHTDVKEANSLDVWVPGAGRRGHVVHYLLDFGKALGVAGYVGRSRQDGWTHAKDVKYTLLTLPTFGLWVRPWEKRRRAQVPAVGLFTSTHYEPESYTPSFPYYPFYEADRFDRFWGAKILVRFSQAQLRAIVGQARYSDARSADYMVRNLVARQRKTAHHWFEQVAPLDNFDVQPAGDGHRLCFDDLMLRYALEADDRSTRYAAEAFDYRGSPIIRRRSVDGPTPPGLCQADTRWSVEVGSRVGQRACFELPTTRSLPREGYLIVRIKMRRHGRRLPAIDLHLARSSSSELRIIGLRRW